MYAVVGPDGSGKSFWIRKRGLIGVHAVPHLKWLTICRFQTLAEFLMSFDRVYASWKAGFLHLFSDKVIMDRCFVCNEVYSMFWAQKLGGMGMYRISHFFNRFLYKPTVIVQLVPEVVNPKDEEYKGDWKELNRLYGVMIETNGYEIRNTGNYPLGRFVLWVRKHD